MNEYVVAIENILGSKSQAERTRIANQCATALALITHERGERYAQLLMGIRSTEGVHKGNWRVTIERVDSGHGLH